MSLVTRCTSCGTLFKVVADQLKISEGWVRCGQCATVFDAQANLMAQSLASSPQPAELAGLSANFSTDSLLDSKLDSPSFRPGALRNSSDIDSEAGPSSSSWAASEYPSQSIHALAVGESISVSAEPTTLNTPAVDSTPQASLPDVDMLGPSTTPDMTPSFVAQAQRAQRWRSPWVRCALGLILIGLVAGLALQVALQEKDRIAAMKPEAKPWLDHMCAYAGCRVQALKSIESITVDASSFNRINKNNAQLEAITQSYRLAVTLKNTGALPVALPHVELSLQDAQDQPILRRVLSPADLGSGLDALAPTQDMAGSLTLQIDTAQLAGGRINGYRVLAFYP